MPRGGFRANAGRKADPNSARQRKLAAKATKVAKAPADRGLTAPDGTKKPEAGATWPFGTTPPTAPAEPPAEADEKKSFATPLEFWEHVLRDPGASVSAKHAAAYAMAPYVHAKLAPAGKKAEAEGRAKKVVATGRFAAKAPPRLVAAGGKPV